MSRFKRIHVGGLVSSKLLQVNLTVDHKDNCDTHFKYPNVADIKDNPLVSVDHSPIVVVVPSNAPIGRPVIILYWY